MKVYFAHGKESGPWGSKIRRLADIASSKGFDVESIDYRDCDDPDLRVNRLLDTLQDEKDQYLLVGSSMGGYVSLVASKEVDAKGLFLLAPALYHLGYKIQTYPTDCSHVEVVHGWSDDVIPHENSIKFCRENDSTLHLISGDHRLNSSIAVVEILFDNFLDAATKNI